MHAHGFGGNQNIRENDDGIDPQDAKGLQRDLGRQVGSFANFQERARGTNGAIFR
jgi:hypothetical protein